LFTTLCLTAFGQNVSDFRVKMNETETSRTISIIGYAGATRNITIPALINNIPVSVIGEGAFQSMSGITSVSLSPGVTTIESGAFSGCSALTSLFIPATVTSIGDSAFSGCSSLMAIEVDPRNQHYRELDGVLFNKAGTRLLYYPSGRIGYYTVPDGVSVAPGAFSDADKLSPESYEKIAERFGSAVFNADDGQSDPSIFTGRNQGPVISGRSTAVCYVSAQGNDANDGLSEAASFRTLAKAIKTAASGDIRTITVIGRIEGGLTLSNVSEKLLISGKPNATDAEKAAIFVNNGFVLQVNGATKLRLEHIEISGGKSGGILIANGASLTLGTGARVSGNSGEHGAGVNIRGQNTSLIMEGNATISGNSASANGGGVFIGERGALIMENTATISGNRVVSGQGGGVFIEDASFIMQGNAVVSGNQTSLSGGGVFALRSSVTLRDNAVIRDNSSGAMAGGAYLEQSTLSLEDNTAISGNNASSTGGGIELASVKDGKGSSVVLQNYAAITDNQAAKGGGLLIGIGESNSVALRDSAAISGNRARAIGGGVFMYNPASLIQESSAGIFDNVALENPNISPVTAAWPVLK
jgi:hypothetical protein